VFVTGESDGSGPHGILKDYATVAYDASTGDEFWARRYDGPAGYDDTAKELAVSPDGTALYVTGQSSEGQDGFGLDTWDYLTIAYDTLTGKQSWLKRFHGRDAVATGLVVSPDGARVYVGGYSGNYVESEYVTIVYAAETGNQLSRKRFGGDGDSNYLTDIALNPEGTVLFVTGIGERRSNDYMTLAYVLR
jgi:DNA-binding beta-propeller fold protein YncE